MHFNSLFSLDTVGEGFVEPNEESDEDTSSINIKNADAADSNADHKLDWIKISSASQIRDLHNVRHKLSPEDIENYRKLTLEIRKFLYNSMVGEDFCVSCETHAGIDENEAIEVEEERNESQNAEKNAAGSAGKGLEARVTSNVSSMEIISDDDDEVISNISDSDSSKADSLESLENKEVVKVEDVPNDPSYIFLCISPAKLNRIVKDMAHVQMRTFFASFPRSFKISTGNVGSDVLTMGNRYYLSTGNNTSLNDTASALTPETCGHSLYLSHLYQRQRTVCYFCGLLHCARSASSKNPCSFQRCPKCMLSHKWSKNLCRENGSALHRALDENNWRKKRRNVWSSQPKRIKMMCPCFFCANGGEANFKCQGLSCKAGESTLWRRCIELLGTRELEYEKRKKPQLFLHLKKKDFVFN
ncbi:conserved hypothetical protein [Theileria equi strain WA]|uniref:Uncharacterized protein n=1 Tax=Theileria equi strain WA TaxID=1537102 RepID=L1LF94_THEEQ|nr:conserved hypothetical protein [Theileria equi strain WA]EKX73949.1 conserved hypothetical protein [Theileria equi strain WA]|eukprot:XP_004833401.1 conserved hypothetical protein [Theileria equi strain WA]